MITDLIDVHAPAIDLQGLVKSFGDNEVLKGIDLTAVSYTHLTLPTKA